MCEERTKFINYLKENGIETAIHYPIAISEQKAYENDKLMKLPIASKIAAEEVSLPMYIGMTREEVDYVIKIVNAY